MTFFGKAELTAKQELNIKRVELGGGNFTYVREMTGREKSEFEKSVMVETKTADGGSRYVRDLKDFRAKLAVCTVCDEKGVLVFEPKDYETLSVNIKSSVLEKICDEAGTLSSISDEDKTQAIKNSESGQAKGTSTESAAN